jgi:hypothetical protein
LGLFGKKFSFFYAEFYALMKEPDKIRFKSNWIEFAKKWGTSDKAKNKLKQFYDWHKRWQFSFRCHIFHAQFRTNSATESFNSLIVSSLHLFTLTFFRNAMLMH